MARWVTYGGNHMMVLAELYGPEVLRLPSTWFTISPRWQRLLYLGELIVGNTWPFMEIRLGSQASVVPFEVTDNDILQPVVMVIPIQFVTSNVAEVVMEVVKKVREEKEEASFQFFPRSVHCRFVSIGKQAFLGLVEKIHDKRIPVLFCRAVRSAATR